MFFFKKGYIIERVLLLLLLVVLVLVLVLVLYFSLKFPENKSVKILWTQCTREKFIQGYRFHPPLLHIFSDLSVYQEGWIAYREASLNSNNNNNNNNNMFRCKY